LMSRQFLELRGCLVTTGLAIKVHANLGQFLQRTVSLATSLFASSVVRGFQIGREGPTLLGGQVRPFGNPTMPFVPIGCDQGEGFPNHGQMPDPFAAWQILVQQRENTRRVVSGIAMAAPKIVVGEQDASIFPPLCLIKDTTWCSVGRRLFLEMTLLFAPGLPIQLQSTSVAFEIKIVGPSRAWNDASQLFQNVRDRSPAGFERMTKDQDIALRVAVAGGVQFVIPNALCKILSRWVVVDVPLGKNGIQKGVQVFVGAARSGRIRDGRRVVGCGCHVCCCSSQISSSSRC